MAVPAGPLLSFWLSTVFFGGIYFHFSFFFSAFMPSLGFSIFPMADDRLIANDIYVIVLFPAEQSENSGEYLAVLGYPLGPLEPHSRAWGPVRYPWERDQGYQSGSY